MKDSHRAKTLFLEALERPAEERAAWLEGACAGDDSLRARVEALLAAEAAAEGVLGPSAEVPGLGRSGLAAAAGRGAAPEVGPGDRLGPYLLEEELGRGGFGVVFRASQSEPVRRQVAVKVVRAGMDSDAALARFELERQALALMEHPNIARVFDAGETPAGRPFVVMELVDGPPVTVHCAGLGLDARLRLFVAVCRAVEHAHQRGVLHRDIKPSNVLVATVDGEAVPKVIDFGIAKATDADLTDSTLVTREGVLLGTPGCMSPEQARGETDIDTRSDVYSLGVLLYELLAGALPFEADGGGLHEFVRKVCEDDPPRPTVRRRQVLAEAQRYAADARSRAVTEALPAELDWVVLRCLEKPRERRYGTAHELAEDLERFLADEPVLAAPPGTAYRLRKFVARHRAASVVGVALVLALVGGTIGTSLGMLRAERLNVELGEALGEAEDANAKLDVALEEQRRTNEELAESNRALDASNRRLDATNQELDAALAESRRQTVIAEEVADFLTVDLLGAARPTGGAASGPAMPVGTLVDLAAAELDTSVLEGGRFADEPLIEAALRRTLGLTDQTLGRFAEAERHMARCVELNRAALGPDALPTLEAESWLGDIRYRLGRYVESAENQARAHAALRRTEGPGHADTLAAAARLANALRAAGRSDESFALLQESLPEARRSLGDRAPVTTDLLSAFAVAHTDRGRFEEAEALFREVLEAQTEVMGAENPVTLNARMNLATVLRALHRYDESLRLYIETVEIQKRVEGPDHPNVLSTLFNLADCLRSMGRFEDGLQIATTATTASARLLGEGHPRTLQWWRLQGGLQQQLGRLDEAERIQREVLRATEQAQGPDHPQTLATVTELALLLHKAGQVGEAGELLARVAETRERTLGPDDMRTLDARLVLGSLHRSAGRLTEAGALFESVRAGADRTLGEGHPLTLEALVGLGLCALQAGDRARAAELLEASAGLARLQGGRATESWRGAAQALAAAAAAAGEAEEAGRWQAAARGS